MLAASDAPCTAVAANMDRVPFPLAPELEHSAVRDTRLVEDLWRFYPKVLGSELRAQTRVEAKLRRAHA
jgi:hypothetical protein